MPFNFRRKAYAQMLEWKSTLADRYALLIEGTNWGDTPFVPLYLSVFAIASYARTRRRTPNGLIGETPRLSKILMPGKAHTRCVEILEFRDYFVACTHFPLKDYLCDIAADIVRLNLTDRDKPVFLAGDLNSKPETKAISILKKGFTILSDVTQNTFPADAPRCCIDYIMVDTKHADKVDVTSRKVIAAPEATDHCALVVKTYIKK